MRMPSRWPLHSRPVSSGSMEKTQAMFLRTMFNLMLAATLFASTGCLLSTSKHVHESGVAVGSGTLRQVELGETTRGWLLTTLGEPTSRAKVPGEENVEILGYHYEIVKASRGKVFLLFSGSSRKVDHSRTFFELRNGVVTRYWTET